MYRLGSKEELYAMLQQLRTANRITRGFVQENAKFDALEAIGTTDLFLAMLQDALNDHFNGSN